MYRSIMENLKEWKERSERKPLLLTGIRQCGKTYILKEFGREAFGDCAYFNFEEDDSLSSIFEHDLNVQRIVDDLSNVILGRRIEIGKTLVIFDEVQVCPRAITALKYFCENMRELHVICAGSLLGVAVKRSGASFPVGKVDRLQMYPMSFSEFLIADGAESLYHATAKLPLEAELSKAYTSALEREYRCYLAVGGMPEAVSKWVDTHDIAKVEEIQDNILSGYAGDFAKHAPKTDVPKLGWIWDSIPLQLAKDNNKFVFSHVKQGKRAADLEDAMQWLTDAGLIHKLLLVENPQLPLAAFSNATYFKVYMADVGLLRRKSGIPARVILGEDDLYQNYKGAMTENFVLTELLSLGISPYFWRSGNKAELDFLFDNDGEIIPVEAKAAIHTRAKSYLQFCKNYRPKRGFKFSLKNVGENDVEQTHTFSLPLYLVWKLRHYLAYVAKQNR